MTMTKHLIFATIVTPLLVATTQAATYVRPSAVDNTDFAHTIDGSGLVVSTSVDVPNTGNTVSDTPKHVTADNSGLNNQNALDYNSRAAGTSTPTIVFNLGGTHDISQMLLWNYSERYNGTYYNDRGVNAFIIKFSTDGGSTFATGEQGNATIAPSFGTPSGNTENFYIEPYKFTFQEKQGVTHVSFEATTNHGAANFTGIGEVRFVTVPEPSSSALLALGGLALILRRKK